MSGKKQRQKTHRHGYLENGHEKEPEKDSGAERRHDDLP
jgi:hypothetical protein